MINLETSFLQKVNKTDTCWLWTAGKDKDGYGKIKFNQVNLRAHRVSWALYRGSIPEGHFVCHKCDTPSCVKPSHLFTGTSTDNNRDRDSKGRNFQSGKTHCINGHEFSVENTTWWRNSRKCRTCERIRYHKRKVTS